MRNFWRKKKEMNIFLMFLEVFTEKSVNKLQKESLKMSKEMAYADKCNDGILKNNPSINVSVGSQVDFLKESRRCWRYIPGTTRRNFGRKLFRSKKKSCSNSFLYNGFFQRISG